MQSEYKLTKNWLSGEGRVSPRKEKAKSVDPPPVMVRGGSREEKNNNTEIVSER